MRALLLRVLWFMVYIGLFGAEEMTFGHSVFDNFAASTGGTQVFHGWFGLCTDDHVKGSKGHDEEYINDCGETADGKKYEIKTYKTCKDRNDPSRDKNDHYYRLYVYEPCEEGSDGCTGGFKRTEKIYHKSFPPTDEGAAEAALNRIRDEAVTKHGMQWKGCMDENASNYDKDAVCDDPDDPCVCKEGYTMSDAGVCEADAAETNGNGGPYPGDAGPAPAGTADGKTSLFIPILAIASLGAAIMLLK